MKLIHNDLEIELSDEWWAEVGMDDFVPKEKTYCVKRVDSREVHEVSFEEVAPVCRATGVDLLKRERTVQILIGFQKGEAIPPVEIIKVRAGGKYLYKLKNGTHRFYCSLVAGFSHVPAVFRNWD